MSRAQLSQPAFEVTSQVPGMPGTCHFRFSRSALYLAVRAAERAANSHI